MTEQAQEKIVAKLRYLEQAASELEAFRGMSSEEFERDKRNKYSVERLFQTALEAAVDIARLVIIDRQLARPGEMRNEFHIMADNDLLNQELADNMADAKKFRNVLVHEYVGIDPAKVREHLQHDLEDLVRYAQAIGQLIQKESE